MAETCRLWLWSVLLVSFHQTPGYFDGNGRRRGGGSVDCSGGLNFLALGDWGGLPLPPYTSPLERNTACSMGAIAKKNSVDWILSLGDNFYYDGVTNDTDPRFQETFESIFTSRSLFVPWFIIAGNHDHHGNVTAQISYSKRSPRWNFPDYYYSRFFEVPDERGESRASLHLITLDTVMLCGLPKGGGDGGGQPIGPCDLQSSKSQLHWLAAQLAHSNATYLLVAGHYPVWSVAEHGPTKCLLSHLRPLLIRYQVTAYLSGHDHCLQYLQEPGLPVGYVISGAGTFMNPSLEHIADVPPGSLRFHFADIEGLGGFVHGTATVQNLTFFYIDGRGKRIFSVTLPPRRPNLN